MIDYIIFYLFFLIITPIAYFSKNFSECIKFFRIPISIRIIFLILYILLYIFSSKKHKKYVLITFIILYLCCGYFIVYECFNYTGEDLANIM